jgi:subtilisin family serine protease
LGFVAAAAVIVAGAQPSVADPVTESSPAATRSDTKPAGWAVAASVGSDVRAAVAKGGADVIVGYDPSEGLAKAQAQIQRANTKAQRTAAAREAFSAFSATKRAVTGKIGRGFGVKRDFDHLPVQLVHVDSPAGLNVLAASPGIVSIQLPQQRTIDAVPTNLSLIKQPEAAAAGYTGSGVTVAVLDSGIDWTLPGVNGAFGDCSNGPGTPGCRIANFATTVRWPDGVPICTDELFNNDVDVNNHHGTNVSGVVAEVAPGARLDVIKVFRIDDCQTGHVTADDGDVLAALNSVIIDAAAHNTRAVNLSLGNSQTYYNTHCSDSAYAQAFQSLRAVGVVPVVAAGNDAFQNGTFQPGGGISDPACASGALSVGAVYSWNLPGPHSWQGGCRDEDPTADTIACFSQTSQLLGLLAPGVLVRAAGVVLSGTSQAAPHVAGAVADLVSANPHATSQQIVRALTSTGPLVTDPRDASVTKHRLDIAAAAAEVQKPQAEVDDVACTTTPIPANDDGSSPAVALPFVADFFGTSYSQAYVNNNGNVTFQGPQATFTPFTLNASVPPIIAPFFADVDTRGAGSGLVTYGVTTYGSRPALCVDWNNVGYYAAHTDQLNSFQLLLVDRGDVGAGDFDIIMNYDTLNWETGDASGGAGGMGGTPAGAGYSAGDSDAAHFLQLPGSLISNGLLDTNADVPNTALVNGSRGSLQRGRYIFPVRNGAPPGAATITGSVRSVGGQQLSGAPVQACPTAGGSCVVGFTASDGHYTIVGLSPRSYLLTALPPAGSTALSAQAGPIVVSTGSTVTVDLVLPGPTPPPADTTITSHGTTGDGIPVLLWTDPISLDTAACTGGTADYAITLGGSVVRSGELVGTPAGSGRFHADVASFYPLHGDASVRIIETCPGQEPTTIDFSIYIDPSGNVVNTLGQPVDGATVTLLRADTSSGPFEAVPDGSAILSPSARSNPETTGTDGVFHWDVLAGFYRVQALKPGCVVPGTDDTTMTSATYEVPPPALGITLVLDCGENATTPITTLTATPGTAVVGQPVLLTATVSAPGALPTGSIAFAGADASVSGCSAQPLNSGVATCSVTFAHATATPHDLTAAYSGDSTHPPSTGHLSLAVSPATPVITWAAPADINYPTPLGPTQLNATADVSGSFVYTLHSGGSANGGVLHAGSGQLIDAVFTPQNPIDYTTATAQVSITVRPGNQVIVVDPVEPATLGSGTTTVTAHGGESGLPVVLASSTSAVCTVTSATGAPTTTATVSILSVGTCTLTASQAGNTDWAAAPDVSVSFAVVAPANSPTVDVTVSRDMSGSGSLTSPAFTTSGSGELILAFVSIDGPKSAGAQRVTSVTGGGLAWSLATRSTNGYGAAEVWQAYATAKLSSVKVVAKLHKSGYDGSITVTAFTGAAARVGSTASRTATKGAASVTLTPGVTDSRIWAAGHNWNSTSSVTTPTSQTVVHQWVDRKVKDVFWSQAVTDASAAGTPVTVRVLTPASGPWQLAAVEVPSAGTR